MQDSEEENLAINATEITAEKFAQLQAEKEELERKLRKVSKTMFTISMTLGIGAGNQSSVSMLAANLPILMEELGKNPDMVDLGPETMEILNQYGK